MVHETVKIMGDPGIRVTATTVRVPVLVGHSESINVETERKLTADEARRILAAAPGVCVVDDPASRSYPMPAPTAGTDEVFVGRIREDNSLENGLNLWVVVRQRAQGRGAERRADCRTARGRRPGARAMSAPADPRPEVRRHVGLHPRAPRAGRGTRPAGRAPGVAGGHRRLGHGPARATPTRPIRSSTSSGPTAARSRPTITT